MESAQVHKPKSFAKGHADWRYQRNAVPCVVDDFLKFVIFYVTLANTS